MKVLKHTGNGRLFLATPALLKNKMLQEASEGETKEFLGRYKKADLAELEKLHQAKKPVIPEDFDWDVDVSFFDIIELNTLAAKIGVSFASGLQTKDMKAYLKDQIAAAKKEHMKAMKAAVKAERAKAKAKVEVVETAEGE